MESQNSWSFMSGLLCSVCLGIHPCCRVSVVGSFFIAEWYSVVLIYSRFSSLWTLGYLQVSAVVRQAAVNIPVQSFHGPVFLPTIPWAPEAPRHAVQKLCERRLEQAEAHAGGFAGPGSSLLPCVPLATAQFQGPSPGHKRD